MKLTSFTQTILLCLGICVVSPASAGGFIAGTAAITPLTNSITITFSTPVGSAIPPADAVAFEEPPIIIITGAGREESLAGGNLATLFPLVIENPNDAAAVRVSNVTTTGFEVAYQRRQITNSGLEVNVTAPSNVVTFNYIAVAPGITRLPNGINIEAGLVTDAEFSVAKPIQFDDALFSSRPAVFSEFQTLNAPTSWQVANSFNSSATGTTVIASNRTGTAPTNNEAIGYMAISEGQTRFVASDGLEVEIKTLTDQAGIVGPDNDDTLPLLINYPTDCNSVAVGTPSSAATIEYALVLAKQSTNQQSGGVTKSCGAAVNGQAPFYIDTERVQNNRNSDGELVDVIAVSRSFYGFFDLIADYHFDSCSLGGTTSNVIDSGPYQLNGVGNNLSTVDVSSLPPAAPQCQAVSLPSTNNSYGTVADDERFDILGTVTMAAWVLLEDTPANSQFPDRRTIAGKGSDAYRLVIEKVCTIDSSGTRVIDEASSNGTGINLCDLSSGVGVASSEIHYVARFEVTNQLTGLTTFIRSTQTGTNTPSIFFDPNGVVTPESWQHLGASFDGFSLVLSLDDNLPATFVSSSAIPLNTNDSPFSIGATLSPAEEASNYFAGAIDEVTVWENALTSETIHVLHRDRTRVCSACKRTIIYWRETYIR